MVHGTPFVCHGWVLVEEPRTKPFRIMSIRGEGGCAADIRHLNRVAAGGIRHAGWWRWRAWQLWWRWVACGREVVARAAVCAVGAKLAKAGRGAGAAVLAVAVGCDDASRRADACVGAQDVPARYCRREAWWRRRWHEGKWWRCRVAHVRWTTVCTVGSALADVYRVYPGAVLAEQEDTTPEKVITKM